LIEELTLLNEHQNEARQTEIYIRMTPQQHEAFDGRTQRISMIYADLRPRS